jgi:hypothetical protein
VPKTKQKTIKSKEALACANIMERESAEWELALGPERKQGKGGSLGKAHR